MAEIVVDSSIWIDFFNKKSSSEIVHLKLLLINNSATSPIIIFPVIIQEVLQGIEDNKLFILIKEFIQGYDYLEYDPYKFSFRAAELYRSLRRKGVTIRKANDCLIAALCIDHNISLFHNDKDFNNIAKHTSLKIYTF